MYNKKPFWPDFSGRLRILLLLLCGERCFCAGTGTVRRRCRCRGLD
jgi:hypothetical protein